MKRIPCHTGDKDTTPAGTNFRAEFLQTKEGTHNENAGLGNISSRYFHRLLCRSELAPFPGVKKRSFGMGPKVCVVLLHVLQCYTVGRCTTVDYPSHPQIHGPLLT